jgi:hypothetical protein
MALRGAGSVERQLAVRDQLDARACCFGESAVGEACEVSGADAGVAAVAEAEQASAYDRSASLIGERGYPRAPVRVNVPRGGATLTTVRDLFRIPRWPRLYCSRVLGHEGYLREIRRIDDEHAAYECRACGWRGVRMRPPNRIRALF